MFQAIQVKKILLGLHLLVVTGVCAGVMAAIALGDHHFHHSH